jgi:hypothetical protein
LKDNELIANNKFVLSNVTINSVAKSVSENITLVLSANRVGLNILFIMYGKSLMYNQKNSGPSIELHCTSFLNSPQSEPLFE